MLTNRGLRLDTDDRNQDMITSSLLGGEFKQVFSFLAWTCAPIFSNIVFLTQAFQLHWRMQTNAPTKNTRYEMLPSHFLPLKLLNIQVRNLF